MTCSLIGILFLLAFAYKNCTENGTWYYDTSVGKYTARYDECYMTPEVAKN